MNIGGAIYVGALSAARFINCTLSGNQAVDGSGFYTAGTSVTTSVNTIVSHGLGGGAAAGAGNVGISCSNVFGNIGGDWIGPIAGQLGSQGNISADPLFVAPGGYDVHLSYNSACRDAGDSSYVDLPERDCPDASILILSGLMRFVKC